MAAISKNPIILTAVNSALLMVACASLIITPIDPDSKLRPGLPAPQPTPHFQRVLIIILENKNFADAKADKYLGTTLGEKGAFFTNFKALFHNSYPNYLALVGGQLFAVGRENSDRQIQIPPSPAPSYPPLSIGDLLEDSTGKHTWKNYAEDFPEGLDPVPEDWHRYVQRHVPFMSFRKVREQERSNVVPVDGREIYKPNVHLTDLKNRFAADVRSGTLPQYAFYSPNLDNDAHDQPLSYASRWLQLFFRVYSGFDPSAPAGAQFPWSGFPPGTLIVITFDESGWGSWIRTVFHRGREKSNQIYVLFLGDMVKRGAVTEAYNHYNLLRTIEDNFRLKPLSDGDSNAKPIEGCWLPTLRTN